MYLIDFFKRMKRKSNIPILIYLFLNVLFIILICGAFIGGMGITGAQLVILSVLAGIAVYALSLAFALSPLGEGILRIQTGCKKVKLKKYQDFLYPIFYEVYDRAREQDPTIPDDVQLFMTNDPWENAFATGRKTVCITRGMMNRPVDQIKAALGHEFGHLAHKDTDLILLVTIGNFFVSAIITMVRLCILMFQVFAAIFVHDEDSWMVVLFGFISMISVDVMMWIWTKLGTWLVMKSSRSNEYEADEFSFNMGYGLSLIQLFESFGSSGAKGLFATLESSHPEPEDRIAHIEELFDLQYAAQSQGAIPQYGAAGMGQPAWTEAAPAIPAAAFTNPPVSRSMPVQEPVGMGAPELQPVNAPVQMRPAGEACVCASCGSSVEPTANFCYNCGTPVVRKAKKVFCTNCGHPEEDPDALFCTECGNRLIRQ